jgi:hypothetical protein
MLNHVLNLIQYRFSIYKTNYYETLKQVQGDNKNHISLLL